MRMPTINNDNDNNNDTCSSTTSTSTKLRSSPETTKSRPNNSSRGSNSINVSNRIFNINDDRKNNGLPITLFDGGGPTNINYEDNNTKNNSFHSNGYSSSSSDNNSSPSSSPPSISNRNRTQRRRQQQQQQQKRSSSLPLPPLSSQSSSLLPSSTSSSLPSSTLPSTSSVTIRTILFCCIITLIVVTIIVHVKTIQYSQHIFFDSSSYSSGVVPITTTAIRGISSGRIDSSSSFGKNYNKYNTSQRTKNNKNNYKQIQQIINKRSLDRRKRTRPPNQNSYSFFSSSSSTASSSNNNKELLHPSPLLYDYQTTTATTSIIHFNNNNNNNNKNGRNNRIEIHNLCGIHAQQAAASSSSSSSSSKSYFPIHQQNNKDKESSQKSSSQRIVITGILSTQIGYNLAIRLYKQCNVESIIGIDYVTPTTKYDRMDTIDIRYKTLLRLIPNFIMLKLPFMGITSQYTTSEINKDLDIIYDEKHPITHIVHLMSYSEEGQYTIDQANAKEIFEQTQPSGTKGVIRGGIDNILDVQDSHSLFQIRNSLISIEHLLQTIMKLQQKQQQQQQQGQQHQHQQPQFIYASSSSLSSSSMKSSSSSTSKNNNNLYSTIMSLNEMIAYTYNNLYGISSIGLRIPYVYGPTNNIYSIVTQITNMLLEEDTMMTQQQQQNNTSQVPIQIQIQQQQQRINKKINEMIINFQKSQQQQQENENEYIYIDDVVDVIISSMQYKPSPESYKGGATIFDVSLQHQGSTSSSTTTCTTLHSIIKEIRKSFNKNEQQGPKEQEKEEESPLVPHNPTLQLTSNEQRQRRQHREQQQQRTKEYLGWPSTTTRTSDGIQKYLNWFMFTYKYPYGFENPYFTLPHSSPSSIVTTARNYAIENSFFQSPRKDHTVNNAVVDIGLLDRIEQPRIYPCASECSYYHSSSSTDSSRSPRNYCTKSVYDDVIPITQKITSKCKYVLYMVDFQPTLQTIPNSTEPSMQPSYDNMVCSIAFVSKESKLVRKLQRDLPTEEFVNGQITFNRWTLVWIKSSRNDQRYVGSEELLRALPKMSPGRFFHTNVDNALFVEPSVYIPPKTTWIIALNNVINKRPKNFKKIGQRKAKQRMVPIRTIFFGTEWKHQENININKFTLPNSVKNQIFAYNQISIKDKKVKKNIERHVTFYDKASSLIKKLRSLYGATRIQYTTFPFIWVRTSAWIVHDLRTMEGKKLRCDWYDEHTYWNNPFMDDMTLAYVLGKRSINDELGIPDDGIIINEFLPITKPRTNDDNDVITIDNQLEGSSEFVVDEEGNMINEEETVQFVKEGDYTELHIRLLTQNSVLRRPAEPQPSSTTEEGEET